MATPTIGQVLGHYRIVEQIGAGGMGVVFRARDQQLERDVALKTLPRLSLLSEASRRQFRREALSLAKIADPHVAMAFDFGCDDGVDYLVTEYVPGLTLEAKLAGRPLPESEVLQLGKELASGLEAAHKEGVIHRDLKPGNLKVTPDGRLKILDFGLAYMLKVEAEATATATAPLTETYSDAGTLPYMSPEQVKGLKPDARADVWSAGAVLYEMSTGKQPFGDKGPLIAAILENMPVAPRTLNPRISEGLERVILRALQKDPKERYQSAGDLRIDLANLATGTVPVYPNPQPAVNWRRWLALGAIATCMLLGGTWWMSHRQSLPVPRSRESKMMAVLPFDSVTNDAPTNALGRGLTETVTANLVRAVEGGDLQLVSTHDLIAHGVKTSEDARREFGTDLVVEGSLQQDAGRTRVTWSVVDPQTHTQIAAGSVTGDSKDIFGLQDRLIEDVVEKLSLAIEPERRLAIQRHLDTKPEAYDFYLRGRGYLEDYQTQDNLEQAITQFQRAIQVDKDYAPAYAAMGLAYSTGFLLKDRSKDWIEKAKTQCERALAINPKLAEGQTCLGKVFTSTGQYEEAVQQFHRSLELDPNSDETLRALAGAYGRLGQMSAAEGAYRKAVALRPGYWGAYSALGSFYFAEARYSDALAMFKQTIRLAPRNYSGYLNLGATYSQLGQYPETVEAYSQSIALQPSPLAYGNLGAAYFYMRRYAESAESLKEALKLDPNDGQNWGNLADTLIQIPERSAEAREAYQKAIDLSNARLEVNPRDANVLAACADYYGMLDQSEKAKDYLARALHVSPNDPDVLFRAAILYNHFGKKEETLDFLSKSISAGCPRTVIRDTPDFDHLKGDIHYRSNILKIG